MSSRSVYEESLRGVEKQRAASARAIGLYAGTNIMSPRVAALHATDLSVQPAMGAPGAKLQRGVEDIEHLEVLATREVASAMRARHAEVRFLSATMANLAVFVALTRPGDTIAVLPRSAGSHPSQLGVDGTASVRGLRVVDLPYSPDLLDVDPVSLPEFVLRERPRLLVVGGSVTLFPHDVAVLRSAADSVGAYVLYDASQCAGLIAAGLFQDPLAEGADVVTFSTYKTFGGPAGGAAVTGSEELARRVSHAAYPILTSNYDAARLAPLAMAAAEATEQDPPWAETSVSLAQGLARALTDLGWHVAGAERGFTGSHQIVVDTARLGGGPTACAILERHRVLASACLLPGQRPDAIPHGARLGTQEIARRGATARDAGLLAELLHRAMTGVGPGETELLRGNVLRRLETDIWGRLRNDPHDVVEGIAGAHVIDR